MKRSEAANFVTVETLETRTQPSAGSAAVPTVPRFDHVVIVVEENKNYGDVLGFGAVPPPLWTVIPPPVSNEDPYLRSLAKHGASFTNMNALTHPSQPNYLAFFSGSNQGISGDTPPAQPFSARSLGGELLAKGLTFKSYSESLPSAGSRVSTSGNYARKHNPSSDFTDVPAADNAPFSAFPHDFTKLPTVSMVIPNLVNDMHSGSIRAADNWLKSNLGDYAKWATSHNSLLIVTWDEGRGSNRIPTIYYGAHVVPGNYGERETLFSQLRTIEGMYGLDALGQSASTSPITGIFK